MATVDPEKLEAEADAMLKQQYEPEAPPGDGGTPEGEVETETPAEETPPAETPAETPAEEEKPKPAEEKPADKPAEEKPAEKETPPEEEEHVDELEGLELRNAKQRIKNAQARMHKATRETADLRRRLDMMEHELLQIRTNPVKQQPHAPAPDAPDIGIPKEKLDQMRSDYPGLETLFDSFDLMQRKYGELQRHVNQTAATAFETAQVTAEERYWNTIRAVHQDADQLKISDDFHGWADLQPPYVQQALFGAQDANGNPIPGSAGTAQDLIAIFTQYKEDVGIPMTPEVPATEDSPKGGQIEGQSGKKAQPAANSTLAEAKRRASPKLPTAPNKNPGAPNSTKGETITTSQIAEWQAGAHMLSQPERDALEAKIDKATQEGRVVRG